MPTYMGNKVKIPIYMRLELWESLENYVKSNNLQRNVVMKMSIEWFLEYAETNKSSKKYQKMLQNLHEMSSKNIKQNSVMA